MVSSLAPFLLAARPTIQNENGKAFEKVATMASDVTQWGFRLFEKKEEAVKVPSEEVQPAAELGKKEEAVAPEETKQEPIATPPSQPEEKKEDVAPPPPEEPKEEPATIPVVSQPEEKAAEIVPKEEEQVNADPAAAPESFPELEPPLPPTLNNDEPVQQEKPVIPEAPVTDAKEEKAPAVVEGDLGQGVLEDKELYTTRDWLEYLLYCYIIMSSVVQTQSLLDAIQKKCFQ